MPLIDIIDVEVKLICSKCGASLEGYGSKTRYGNPLINVTPCQDCLDNTYNKEQEESK